MQGGEDFESALPPPHDLTHHAYPLDRLTPISWERLIRRHIDQCIPLLDLPVQVGIGLRTAYKWLTRFRHRGSAALVDLRSVRCSRGRWTLDKNQLQQAVQLRHQFWTLRLIARALQAPL